MDYGYSEIWRYNFHFTDISRFKTNFTFIKTLKKVYVFLIKDSINNDLLTTILTYFIHDL